MSRLKEVDIEFMRRLHGKVNLVPVIAKSDTLTDEEIVGFKARVSTSHSGPRHSEPLQILSDIERHGIQIFRAPLYDNEDEETISENQEILVGCSRYL